MMEDNANKWAVMRQDIVLDKQNACRKCEHLKGTFCFFWWTDIINSSSCRRIRLCNYFQGSTEDKNINGKTKRTPPPPQGEIVSRVRHKIHGSGTITVFEARISDGQGKVHSVTRTCKEDAERWILDKRKKYGKPIKSTKPI